MATRVVWMRSILLLLSNVAATIDGNSISYNSSVELYQEGNLTEELVNSSTTQYEPPGPTQTTGSTTQLYPVTNVSAEALPLSGRLPAAVQEGFAHVMNRGTCATSTAAVTRSVVRSGNEQLCHREVVHYSLGKTGEGFSMQNSFIQKYVNADIFCIQSQNHVESLSYTLPAIPTDRNFDSLFKEFVNFPFSFRSNDVLSVSSGYQYGDMIETAGENGERRILQFPGAAVNINCLDTNPVAFLQQQISRCTIHMVVDRDCTNLQALNMYTYTGIQILSMVPMLVTSATLKSLEDTLSPVELSPAKNLEPTLVNPTLCLNVLHQVAIVVKYNHTGQIVNVSANLVLGPVRGIVLSLEQEFQITFVQSSNPIGTLSILQSGENQDCLCGPHERSPVLFGQGMVSGCMLNLEEGANCSLVANVLLDVLRGSGNMQYVAAFGTPTLDNSLDWVPLETIYMPGGAQSCTMPLSRHLEIKWTKYGSLENPQAQILSIKELIHTNSSNMALLFGGSTTITVTSSVNFVPISAPSEPGFQAPPTIDAKLPFEFFFPFM
ncbi:Tectonic-1 [Merluccius polli]|uniref:Tectonic-1 n=1 Tax=Merluccius polli TaxID=89951 RepID=A0AA47N6S1_MERPO|nr:Tectonic-1 [Merluccius polli]